MNRKKWFFILALNLCFSLTEASLGRNKNKVQEVNFEEMTLHGQIKNPQGAYLVQKNRIKFLPLIEIQKDLDKKIRKSSELYR